MDPSADRHAEEMSSVRGLVAARSRESPDGTFLEGARDDRVLTWAGLAEVTAAWRARLDALGLPSGARVSLRVADPLRFAAAFLGVLAAGRVVAPLSPDPGPAALARHLDTVRPAAVLSPAPGAPGVAASPLADDLGGAWATVDRREDPDDPAGPDSADSAGGAGGAGGADSATPRLDGAGLVLASSGTTGPPKLVELTEAQLLHTAAGIAGHHRFTPADRGFNPLALFHVNAEVVGLLTALVAGSQLVLDDRFHRTGFWPLLAQRRITWLNGVPAILAILAQEPPVPRPTGLRFARSASAPLPAATLLAFEAATGVGVVETYGMTEAGSQITANPVDGGRRPGSVGRPVGVELEVVDDAGVPVAGDLVGRVRIRGAGVITDYASPAGRERIGADGWLDTGDLGRTDADGFLHLAGRGDDIINRGGEKFFPAEVEDVLREDPDVLDAVVVGWPDPVLGAVPVAAVVARAGLDEAAVTALRARLRIAALDRLDRPRRPARTHVVDRLPAGVNGKVSRRAVREDLAARFGDDPVGRGERG